MCPWRGQGNRFLASGKLIPECQDNSLEPEIPQELSSASPNEGAAGLRRLKSRLLLDGNLFTYPADGLMHPEWF